MWWKNHTAFLVFGMRRILKHLTEWGGYRGIGIHAVSRPHPPSRWLRAHLARRGFNHVLNMSVGYLFHGLSERISG